MSNCCDRFVMIEGEEDSFETWQGLRGPYYTPSVSEDGTLSWTNNGGLQNPADINIKGPPGPGGKPGGTTGQILAKASDEDFDTEWIDQPEMDAGHVSYDSTEAYDDGTVGKELTTINSALSSLDDAVNDPVHGLAQKAPIIINTASGDIASFHDGADDMPIRKLVANIVPKQAGSGDPSPDNVRPITGWTGVQGAVTGVNVWDEVGEIARLESDGSAVSASRYLTDYIPIKAGETYAVHVPYIGRGRGAFYDSGKTLLSYFGDFPVARNESVFPNDGSVYSLPDGGYFTFIAPAGACYLRYNAVTSYGTTYNHDISINYPSTDTAYHSGTANEPISVSFPTTVYGGTDEVISGNGDATHTIVTLDGTQSLSLNGTLAYGGAQIIYTPNPAKAYAVQQETEDLLSNIFHTDGSYADPFYFNGRKTNGNIYFNMPAGVTTVQEAKDWFANNPTQVWYKLATPQAFTTDPVALDTLYGTNNIWVDVGAVSVEYPSDTKLYIDGIGGTPDEDMIANDVIASGKYFMVNNRLFKSTASIAKGAQIIPNTNCTETNLVEALNALM